MSHEVLQELNALLRLIEEERQAEREIFRERFLNTPLDQRVAEGTTWYPVQLRNEEIGLGDHLVLELERHATGDESSVFQSGSVASLWSNAQPGAKAPPFMTGVVVKATASSVFLAMEADELPDWTDEGKLGLDLYYDERTYDEMQKAVEAVRDAKGDRLAELRDCILGPLAPAFRGGHHPLALPELNESQNEALNLVLSAQDLAIVHGPPGTGKTTTLVRAIAQTLKQEPQVLVCAASNLAVDLLTEKLAAQGVRVLRLGHPARISEDILRHSLDVQVAIHPSYKEMKNFRREAEKIRRQALKFKRKFGKAERDERRQLLGDARALQREARNLERFILKDLVDRAEVIACTLSASAGSMLEGRHFSTLFIDEAAQALEPACWIPIRKADRVVFAGDDCQLPPTVKSRAAAQKGLAESLFEKARARNEADVLLRTQYRMHRDIMGFSSQQFYGGRLEAHPSVADHRLGTDPEQALLYLPVQFVDTAGCGFEEVLNPDSLSRANPGEGDIALRHMGELLGLLPKPDVDQLEESPSVALISPYKDQVKWLRRAAQDYKPLWPWLKRLNIDTVDGFQGQERDIVYISLVRSNAEGGIGFLADTRRMNVAMTRARKKLVIVGDSATISNHQFYQQMLDYVDRVGGYASAWEYMEY